MAYRLNGLLRECKRHPFRGTGEPNRSPAI